MRLFWLTSLPFSSALRSPHLLGCCWVRILFNQTKRFPFEVLTRPFPQARSGDVGITFEAVEVLLSHNIAKCVISKAKNEVVLTAQFALQIITNIGQRLARNRQNLCVAQIDEV